MQKYRNLYHFLYFFSNPSSLPGLQCMNGIHNIHLLYLSGRPSYCQQCGHNSNSHNHHKLSVWHPPCGPPSGGHQPLIHKTMGRQAHKNSCRRSEKSIYHSLRPDHMEKLFPSPMARITPHWFILPATLILILLMICSTDIRRITARKP